METHLWHRREIAGERTLMWSYHDVVMAFGLGPPRAAAAPGTRCRQLLEAARPRLHAVRWARQVHGREILVISRENGAPIEGSICVGPGDALMTPEPGVAVAVWSADCVPVLVEGGGVVAAVHSGWRGTAQDIVGEVVRAFDERFGVPPHRLRAAIGPAISGRCYEVGPEVVEALQAIGIESEKWLDGDRVDLRSLLDGRLEQLGLPRESVSMVGPCTASTPYLASYRRDGCDAGRQLAFAYRLDQGSERRPRS